MVDRGFAGSLFAKTIAFPTAADSIKDSICMLHCHKL